VLALVEFLAPAIKEVELDLDTIDGEFYWRCCRVDLLAKVRELRVAAPVMSLPEEPPEDDELLLKELRERREWTQQSLFLEFQASELYPRVVWDRLVRGDWLPMRLPEGVRAVNSFEGPPEDRETLLIAVHSGAWTGADVERKVVESAEWSRGRDPEDPASRATVRLQFRLLDGPSEESERVPYFRARRYPCILLVVGFPLPPPGTVAREYDAIVRDQRQWHLALPGATSRQDKEVALRTWAVGLLVAAGVRFVAAMRDVCEAGQLGEVSQARFGQDRQRLVERVPEAAEYLFARD